MARGAFVAVGACMEVGDMHGRGCAWWGHAWQRGHGWQRALVAGDMHGREHVWQGETCVAVEIATMAVGMHPTVMHTCYDLNSGN